MSRRKNRTLWTAQTLLAALFLFAGGMKLALPAAVLAGQVSLPIWLIRLVGVAEVSGALGLVLPGLLGIRVGLTPLAAAGLSIVMLGATILTVSSGGIAAALMPFLVGALAVLVARSRVQTT